MANNSLASNSLAIDNLANSESTSQSFSTNNSGVDYEFDNHHDEELDENNNPSESKKTAKTSKINYVPIIAFPASLPNFEPNVESALKNGIFYS